MAILANDCSISQSWKFNYFDECKLLYVKFVYAVADICATQRCCQSLCICNGYQTGMCKAFDKVHVTCMCTYDYSQWFSPPGTCAPGKEGSGDSNKITFSLLLIVLLQIVYFITNVFI